MYAYFSRLFPVKAVQRPIVMKSNQCVAFLAIFAQAACGNFTKFIVLGAVENNDKRIRF